MLKPVLPKQRAVRVDGEQLVAVGSDIEGSIGPDGRR